MQLFAAISPGENPELKTAVERDFSERHYEVAPGQYLIAADPVTTTNSLSAQLGIPGGQLGRVLILRFTNSAGWHSKNMWEWIEAMSAAPPITPGDANG